MGVTNLYPNLPGHLVEFKDGGLQFVTKDTATYAGNSLLILGTAFDGPINNPVKIDSNTVSTVFGSELDENGRVSKATLVKIAKQAFKNGFTDVRCMRVTGKPASATAENKQLIGTITEDKTFNGSNFNVNFNSVSPYNGPDIATIHGELSIVNNLTLKLGERVIPSEGASFSQSKVKVDNEEINYITVNIPGAPDGLQASDKKRGLEAVLNYTAIADAETGKQESLIDGTTIKNHEVNTYSGVDLNDPDGDVHIYIDLGESSSKDSTIGFKNIEGNPSKPYAVVLYKLSNGNVENSLSLAVKDTSYGVYTVGENDEAYECEYANIVIDRAAWNNLGLRDAVPATEAVAGNYSFNSYSDAEGTDSYSTGGTVSIEDVKEFDGVTYTKVNVITNPNHEELEGSKFWIQADVSDASFVASAINNTIFRLYEDNGESSPIETGMPVYIKVTAENVAYAPATEAVEGVTFTELYAEFDTVVLSHNYSLTVPLTDPKVNAENPGNVVISIPVGENSTIAANAIKSVEYVGSGDHVIISIDDVVFDSVSKALTIPEACVADVPDGYQLVVTYEVSTKQYEEYSIKFQTTNGGSKYNTSKLEIVPDSDNVGEVIFRLTKAEGRNSSSIDSIVEFSSVEFPTVDLLALGMSNDILNNGEFEVIYDNGDIPTNTIKPMAETAFSCGDDGVNISEKELFEALSGIRDEDGYLIEAGSYQLLENYNVDYVYPAGAYADSTYVDPVTGSTFHRELAMLCAVLTYRTKMTHGFIDVKPNSNTSLKGVSDYVDKLVRWSNENLPLCMKDNNGDDIIDGDGNKMEIGWYTSIVVGPDVIITSDKLGTYYGSPAIAYAALNAVIAPQSAPTMKALTGCIGMRYEFSNKQQNELIGARFVVFKTKNNNKSAKSSTPYVVDGCTAGSENCDYARFSTVKVVTDVVDQIREVCEPFLGEPNTIEQRNAMSALISKRLSYLMENGEILHFEFEVLSTLQQMLLGECQISLTVVPPMELRKITTVVALRAAA